MNTKVDRLHTLVNQPKIVPSYEDLDESLQEWYLERSVKRMSEGLSESSRKKAILNMIKATDTKEKLRYEDEIEEVGYNIGSQGDSCKRKKDQQKWFVDDEQGKILKLHKELEERRPHLRGKPSTEKVPDS